MPYSHLSGHSANPKHQRLERCECGAAVSLLKPNRRASAAPWQCVRCGTIILAIPQRRDGSEFHGGIRRADFRQVFSRGPIESLISPSRLSDEDIQRLRNCTACTELPEHELRQSQRYAIAAPVTIVPLNSRFGVAGAPALAYSIDISTGGMAILHPEAATAAIYAVEFVDPSLNIPPVILRPLRCSQLGDGYAIAGEFVCRVDY